MALERVVERAFYLERLVWVSRLALVFAQGTAVVDHPTRFAGLPFLVLLRPAGWCVLLR
jgi:hypothetical protein